MLNLVLTSYRLAQSRLSPDSVSTLMLFLFSCIGEKSKIRLFNGSLAQREHLSNAICINQLREFVDQIRKPQYVTFPQIKIKLGSF